MGAILSFFSENNATIIRILSILVAVGATVLLYRVIFVQNVGPVEQPATVDLTEVGKKVNEQKIEIETLKSESEGTKIELEKQRTEVYNLRQTLKEKEIEVETIKSELQQAKSAGDEAKKLDYEKHQSEVILSTADENLVFQKEISELKRRLSDYEIIAEDISDMQKLKDENEKLKQRLGGSDPDPVATSDVVVDTAAPTEIPVLDEPALESPALEMNMQDVADLVATVAEGQAVSDGIETEIRPPAMAKSPAVETETLEPVSEIDKNLMEKFEKQKET